MTDSQPGPTQETHNLSGKHTKSSFHGHLPGTHSLVGDMFAEDAHHSIGSRQGREATLIGLNQRRRVCPKEVRMGMKRAAVAVKNMLSNLFRYVTVKYTISYFIQSKKNLIKIG